MILDINSKNTQMRLSAKPINPIIVDVIKSPKGQITQIYAGLIFNPSHIQYGNYYEILNSLKYNGLAN